MQPLRRSGRNLETTRQTSREEELRRNPQQKVTKGSRPRGQDFSARNVRYSSREAGASDTKGPHGEKNRIEVVIPRSSGSVGPGDSQRSSLFDHSNTEGPRGEKR
jgi:hypothetical protein